MTETSCDGQHATAFEFRHAAPEGFSTNLMSTTASAIPWHGATTRFVDVRVTGSELTG